MMDVFDYTITIEDSCRKKNFDTTVVEEFSSNIVSIEDLGILSYSNNIVI